MTLHEKDKNLGSFLIISYRSGDYSFILLFLYTLIRLILLDTVIYNFRMAGSLRVKDNKLVKDTNRRVNFYNSKLLEFNYLYKVIIKFIL